MKINKDNLKIKRKGNKEYLLRFKK